MDSSSTRTDFPYTCYCGRPFQEPGPFKFHQNSCTKNKKRLATVFDKAKSLWHTKKRRKLEYRESLRSLDSEISVSETPLSVLNLSTKDVAESSNLSDNQPESETGQTVALPEATRVESNYNESLSQPLSQRRTRRLIRLPRFYRDNMPEPLPILVPALSEPTTLDITPPSTPAAPSGSPTISSHSLQLSDPPRLLKTLPNKYGLFRQYYADKLPVHDPEEFLELDDCLGVETMPDDSGTEQLPRSSMDTGDIFCPYPNENSFRLGDWFWGNGPQKLRKSFHDLVSIVGDSRFKPEDVRNTKWDYIDAQLGQSRFDSNLGEHFDASDERAWVDDVDPGWKRTPISISVPFHSKAKNRGPQNFLIGDLHHRSLVSLIREKVTHPQDGQHLHFTPSELLWEHSFNDSLNQRIHGELYNAQAFLEVHRELQDSLPEPGCNLPRVVAALMFYSDATHLTTFGESKLWPVYLYYGNESKYRRSKPSARSAQHVAYLQSIPDAIVDFIGENLGRKGAIKELLTHCRRELFHIQWMELLDDDFLEAYLHGIVITCWDGITRRFYPRILTYSADYPEKVLIATIRNKSCPRCLIPSCRTQYMGTERDMAERETLLRKDDDAWRDKVSQARKFIYDHNAAVKNQRSDYYLKSEALVPTTNAFSSRLASTNFSLFRILVTDLMHEIELGVWKSLFIHLLRILESEDKSLLVELDRRYRQIPSFGIDTIRRFASNISELKKLAARDYEDMLQCAIAVFDGLLPEPHNTTVVHLLFTLAYWHGLAKLRMHTDQTLDILDKLTGLLGSEFRFFKQKTCAAFKTRELKRETDARNRRKAKDAAKATAEVTGSGRETVNPSRDPANPKVTLKPKNKEFSLDTIKYHFLGDYPKVIRYFGTTDSYSSERGEREHTRPKARYMRTDKRAYTAQLTQIERREERLRRIRSKHQSSGQLRTQRQEIRYTDPRAHHFIGASQSDYEHIGLFLRKYEGDPAVMNFLPKLKLHLLNRILAQQLSENNATVTSISSVHVSLPDPKFVLIRHDRMYKHKILRINYTTYDVQRSYDVVNASTSRCNILTLANIDDHNLVGLDHPFRYGRVLGSYHVNVIYNGNGLANHQPRRMEFLWIRWYCKSGRDLTGWDALKLDRLRFLPIDNDHAFGFVDPNNVIRGCHILPRFAGGRSHPNDKGRSQCAADSLDWKEYYVNRFADRDMLMRYHYGLAVGHIYSHLSQDDPSNAQDKHSQDAENEDYITMEDYTDAPPVQDFSYDSDDPHSGSESDSSQTSTSESVNSHSDDSDSSMATSDSNKMVWDDDDL